MIEKICVYDLDGTLIDSTHRYKAENGKIDLPHWREHDTAEFIKNDSLMKLAERAKSDIENPTRYVIFATIYLIPTLAAWYFEDNR